MAASDPHNHDASLSDAAENLGPRSLSCAHRGLRVSFYVYNVLPVNLSLPLTKEFWSDPIRYGGSGRVRRRAVVLRGFVDFLRTHTRSTVPLGRSVAALGAIQGPPQIPIPFKGIG